VTDAKRQKQHRPRALVDRVLSPATGWLHRTPDFIVIGAARSGTTGVLNFLRATPGVLECPTEELHFFDSNRYRVGMAWYRRQFPWAWERRLMRLRRRGPGLTGENSPFYLAYPPTPERVRRHLPDVRLIALLRDPADRAVSHWNWRVNRGRESRTFEVAIRYELAQLRGEEPPPEVAAAQAAAADAFVLRRAERTWLQEQAHRLLGSPEHSEAEEYRTERFEQYVARGLYLEQIRRWHAAFGRDRLLVLVSERFFADPMTGMRQVWAHVGLDPLPELPQLPKNAIRRKLPVDPAVVQEIRDYCRPHNAELAAYLGIELPWA
jgi:hypothetical protein